MHHSPFHQEFWGVLRVVAESKEGKPHPCHVQMSHRCWNRQMEFWVTVISVLKEIMEEVDSMLEQTGNVSRDLESPGADGNHWGDRLASVAICVDWPGLEEDFVGQKTRQEQFHKLKHREKQSKISRNGDSVTK